MRHHRHLTRIWTVPVLLLLLTLSGVALRSSATRSRQISSNGALQTPDSTPPWKDRTRSEQKDYMRDVVTPHMAKLFAEFDPTRFANVKCVTCHGDGARTSTFKMPDAKLPKIPRSAAGMNKLEVKMPAIMKFMRDSVTSQMASLMGVKTYTCESCHMLKR